MQTDEDLRSQVMGRLDAIPTVDSSDIQVAVDGGVVTLNGAVVTRQTRFQVERSVRRVSGIRGLDMKLILA